MSAQHSADYDAGLTTALVALLREYTAGAYMTLNRNRDAMVRAGHDPNASGADVIRAGLGDWPESFLSTRRDLVDDVREAIIPPAESGGSDA